MRKVLLRTFYRYFIVEELKPRNVELIQFTSAYIHFYIYLSNIGWISISIVGKKKKAKNIWIDVIKFPHGTIYFSKKAKLKYAE